MGLSDALDDRQAEAESAGLGLRTAGEALEDPLAVVVRHPRAFVLDRDPHARDGRRHVVDVARDVAAGELELQ